MIVKNLHKIKRIKREDGMMSFSVLNNQYKVEIDYSLMPQEQIAQILGKEIYRTENGDLYITN